MALLQHEINELNIKYRNEIRAATGLDDQRERWALAARKFEPVIDEKRKQIESELLPHQFERLSQLEMQKNLHPQLDSTFSVLRIRDLQLSELQESKIKALAATLDEEMENEARKMREKLIKMREDAKSQIMNELTREQHEQYDKLMGPILENSSTLIRWFQAEEAKQRIKRREKVQEYLKLHSEQEDDPN